MVPCYLVTERAVTECWDRHSARKLARERGLTWGRYAVAVINETDDEADAERVADAQRALQARKLFEHALELVQSASIRAWARRSNNRWLFCKWLRTCIMSGRTPDVHLVTAFIVSSAIGL